VSFAYVPVRDQNLVVQGRRISSVIAGLIRLRIGLGWKKKENAHCVVFWMGTTFFGFLSKNNNKKEK